MRFGRKIVICLTLAMVLLATSLLAGCGSSNVSEKGENTGQEKKVYNLKVADMSPPSSISAQAFTWWGSEIEKRTNGQVKFQYFWSGSLVGALELLDAVKSGNIDVSPYYSSYHPDVAPLPAIGLLPMMNTELESGILASDELFRTHSAVEAEFKKNNVEYMFPANTLYGLNISNVPLNSINDFKGITYRAFGPFLALFKELGSNVVSLQLPEVHDALDKGAIDGTFNYISNMTGNRDYEVAKYLNTSNLGHNVGMPAVMNLDTWNSLPADIQKVIEEVNAETVQQMIKLGQELYEKDIQTFKDNGTTLTEFPANEIETLQQIAKTKVWEPYAEDLEKKGIPGKDVLNTYLQLIEKNSK